MTIFPRSPVARRWLWIVLAILATVGTATAMVLQALEENVSFYKTPTELVAMSPGSQHIRLGGLVKHGTVIHNGTSIFFTVTDKISDINVQYTGLLPDLFREGQGVVVEGRLLAAGTLAADRLLAKHDENYMPPEVAKALQQAKP